MFHAYFIRHFKKYNAFISKGEESGSSSCVCEKFVVFKGFGSVPESTVPDFEKADGDNFEYFPELSLTAL